MGNLKILETVLEIPGLERPVTLLHITDLHLEHIDDDDSELLHRLQVQYQGYFPHSDEILGDIAGLLKREPPDAVVYTGDISGFPTRRNAQIIQDFLADRHPPYLFIFGNHERILTADDLPAEKQARYNELYRFAIQEDPDVQVMELAGVRLIGLDDSDNQISESQLEKLEGLFADGKPCILFFHVPMYQPEQVGPITEGWKAPLMIGTPIDMISSPDSDLVPHESTKRFVRRMTEQDSPVQAIFAGHVHAYDMANEFYPGKMQILTPLASQFDGNGLVRRIRLIPTQK